MSVTTHCPACEVESRDDTAPLRCWSCDDPTEAGPLPRTTVEGAHTSRRLFAGATLAELVGESAA